MRTHNMTFDLRTHAKENNNSAQTNAPEETQPALSKSKIFERIQEEEGEFNIRLGRVRLA